MIQNIKTFINVYRKMGFLHMLNRTYYDYRDNLSIPFTEDSERLYEDYVKRKRFINRIYKKLHIKNKLG